jgi:hypothetical protein
MMLLSESFCRKLTEKSLPSLLIFHVNIVKLANIATHFLSHCDQHGDYSIDAVIPKTIILAVKKDIKETLLGCRDNRNKATWLSFCKGVCENFSLVNSPNYFEPNLAQFNKYNKFLESKLEEIAAEAAQHPLTSGGAKRRILEGPAAASTDSGATAATAAPAGGADDDKAKALPVFAPGLKASVTLGTWKTQVSVDEGCDFFAEGDASQITEAIFNSVKTLLQMARDDPNSQTADALTTEEKEALGNSKRKLKGVGVWSGLMVSVLVLLFNW